MGNRQGVCREYASTQETVSTGDRQDGSRCTLPLRDCSRPGRISTGRVSQRLMARRLDLSVIGGSTRDSLSAVLGVPTASTCVKQSIFYVEC